ncbi:MAG: Leucine-tRNA ligase [Parcubacteria group bacterium GW2011_GWA2_49_9]|nr:MAG: Leucine-tRNA ligase [Parcubacteria group bacterium GW2011_GWA2_49_9]
MPVDMYVGGAEHATRHLIYARFWHKFLFDIGVVSTEEPFQRLQNVGLILASDGRKMSKRFGNVVNPDEIVERFGADSLRVYEMFMGPFNQAIAWNTDSLVGARRFLERVWKLREKISSLKIKDGGLRIQPLLHQTIKKVGDDIEAFRFNTAVSSLMILLNALEKEESVSTETCKTVITLLAPFAPHLSEELWAHLGYKKSIHLEKWPEYDEKIAISSPITIIVQVNGKTRGSFITQRGDSEEQLKTSSFSLSSVQKWLEGKTVKKTIVVPDRLVNIVIQE